MRIGGPDTRPGDHRRPPAGQAGVSGDTLDPNWVPAGFGTLRQDDIALKSSPANGLQIRAIPLDERIIRLLSPIRTGR